MKSYRNLPGVSFLLRTSGKTEVFGDEGPVGLLWLEVVGNPLSF